MSDVQNYYNMLLDSGELFDVCPKTVGEWGEDKTIFMKYFTDMNKLVSDFEDDDSMFEEGESFIVDF